MLKSLDDKEYYIKDMGMGTGTFIKVDKDLVLKTGYIISFGDSHMVSTIKPDKLHLKFLDGPKVEQEL